MDGGVVIGAAALGAGIALSPVLSTGRRLFPLAAFVPPLIMLGPGGYAVSGWVPVLVAAIGALGAGSLLHRRDLGRLVPSVGLLLAASGLLLLATRIIWDGPSDPRPLRIAVGVVLTSVPFVLASLARGSWRARHWISPWRAVLANARSVLAIHLTYWSVALLVALSYPRLGGAAFLAGLAPVACIRLVQSRYAQARATYIEVVRALGRLAEAGGYVPDGHHERVAVLSVRLARVFRLGPEREQIIRLLGLLHEIGAVSVADPSDLEGLAPEWVANASARVLEETGYLRDAAHVLGLAARPSERSDPIEARMLRVVCAFDRASLEGASSLEAFRGRVAAADRHVLDALDATLALSAAR